VGSKEASDVIDSANPHQLVWAPRLVAQSNLDQVARRIDKYLPTTESSLDQFAVIGRLRKKCDPFEASYIPAIGYCSDNETELKAQQKCALIEAASKLRWPSRSVLLSVYVPKRHHRPNCDYVPFQVPGETCCRTYSRRMILTISIYLYIVIKLVAE
jgi:hypothetical protein